MPNFKITFAKCTTMQTKRRTDILPKRNQLIVVLLLSLTDLVSGQGKKRVVLNKAKKYLILDSRDKEYTKDGRELKWENDLAFLSFELKIHGSIVKTSDGWGLIDTGKIILKEGIQSFLVCRDLNIYGKKLSDIWYIKAKKYYEIEYGNYKNL